MQIERNTAVNTKAPPPQASQPSALEVRADAMLAQASRFGALDTRALATAMMGPMLAGKPVDTGLMQAIGSQLSPVQQGDLQRDLTDIVNKLVDAIAKFFASVFGKAEPSPPVSAPSAAPALPPTAASSAALPDVAAIANDPTVRAAIGSAWSASNPNTPGAKVETGFWVVRDTTSGQLSVVQFPSNGTNDSLRPGAPPAIDGKSVVAFFHTHPNTAAEGYVSGPSSADQRFADAVGVPGIIRSHDGMYYFNPR